MKKLENSSALEPYYRGVVQNFETERSEGTTGGQYFLDEADFDLAPSFLQSTESLVASCGIVLGMISQQTLRGSVS